MMFADRLTQWPEHTALIHPQGFMSYAELAEACDEVAEQLTGSKCLILLVADQSMQALVVYLAALRTGQAVMLQPADIQEESLQQLLELYQPRWLWRPGMQLPQRQAQREPLPPLHPDLAVLLSTSGSTGSPKQVRLSYSNLEANARSIAQYLELDDQERPLVHLPLSYSYGLSIVNSHLLVGAALVLCPYSMMERPFWQWAREQSITSLSGVPFHYEMLERLHFERICPPSLTCLTQAGGKLAEEKISRWSEFAEAREMRFIPMYGQTEATARISYLPWSLVAAYPESIGIPIPGGELQLWDEQGQPIEGCNQAGELVYRGPNVMMGYASSRADLSQGPELEWLHTGDIALRNEAGLYCICGRKKRFIKLFGLRVNLDEVERWLQRQGWQLACIGQDQCLQLALVEAEDDLANVSTRLRQQLQQQFGFHPSVVHVRLTGPIPLTHAGKTDYQQLQQLWEAVGDSQTS